MSLAPRMSSSIAIAKEKLAAAREKVQRQHEANSPAVQVCAHFTDSLEQIVIELFQAAFMELSVADRHQIDKSVALVALGGFGRREMAPYSDIDLMLLHPLSDQQILPLSRRFSQHLYDTGMEVGFSARTPSQACELALQDATVFTSLSESRLILGDDDLYDGFRSRLIRKTKVRWRKLFPMVEASRTEERNKYGETVFLLEPNVKRSSGGLRDLQLIRWLGFIRCQESEFEALNQAGWLSKEDLREGRKARDYLLWLRNDMHFHAKKASDLLDRAEQLRLAEGQQYPAVEGLLPVEQFMRDYFQHTSTVREIAAHFAASARPRSTLRSFFEPLLSHQFEGDYRVGPVDIGARRRGLTKLRGDLGEVLRLLDLANLTDKPIAHETWRAIRETMKLRGPANCDEPLPPEVAQRFMSLLNQPARLGELLRLLHELRVLEQIVPGMSHARGLLQFNAYHRYTVDEHSLRAVEEVTRLAQHRGKPGDIYRALKQKSILHLALLIHDLGKGYVEDHSEVGKRLAERTAHRLGLSEHDTQTLVFLVHKHLRMNDLAQQHDIHDDKVVVPFAVEVGSPENLQLLYLLTLADLASVGPGVLNEWKEQLITDLYDHALGLLASDSPADAMNERQQQRRSEVRKLAEKMPDQPWWRSQIDALPSCCLFASPPERLVDELDRLHRLSHNQAIAWGRFLENRNVIEYTVGTYEEMSPGIFHRLTGALSSMRQQILSAEINTLAEGMVLDRFYVLDQEFAGRPDDARLQQVSDSLVAALKDGTGKAPIFRRLWQDRTTAQSAATKIMPTRVTFDNTTSERYTIVAVFAYDRMGLLYSVTQALFELGLSVSIAKIGTHLDQVVDVFYVTDRATGRKITDETRLHEVQERLLAAIAEEVPT
jgi:[protein-PII] uridylyltransferase